MTPRESVIVIAPTALRERVRAALDGADIHFVFADDEEHMPGDEMTHRELEVVAALGDGLSNREIGERLGISEHTVKFHLASIFGKLGATTRAGAVRRAFRRGLLMM
jgi:DNA-binding NarL/FixJ family response regulator